LAKSIKNRAYLSIRIHKHNKQYVTYRIKQKYTKHTTIYRTIKKEPKDHHYTVTLRYTSPHFTTLYHTSLHFATLHHTSPNYTSLHLSTLHSLMFTLHYSLIWLNPPTFPIVLFHLTSLN